MIFCNQDISYGLALVRVLPLRMAACDLWLQSYLENRRQFCRVNGTCSDLKDIDCGVLQGSCLGPLLFLIYINDLPLALHKCNLTMYADDTSISHSSKKYRRT